MKKEDFNSEEEYKEYRRKANINNRKYFSKPEKHKAKIEYGKIYRKENKDKISEYGYKLRARPEYQLRIKKWREDNKEYIRKKGVEILSKSFFNMIFHKFYAISMLSQ